MLWSFCNWASGAAMHRKITRQSRWNLRRVSDKAIPNQAPGMVGEGVETGWRASLVDEGTVRLSSKGESARITQRSVVQIHPPNQRNHRVTGNWALASTDQNCRIRELPHSSPHLLLVEHDWAVPAILIEAKEGKYLYGITNRTEYRERDHNGGRTRTPAAQIDRH